MLTSNEFSDKCHYSFENHNKFQLLIQMTIFLPLRERANYGLTDLLQYKVYIMMSQSWCDDVTTFGVMMSHARHSDLCNQRKKL
jgi:uncharacterized protein (DUF608 family)